MSTLERRNITIVGAWNQAILTPGWLASNVFDDPARAVAIELAFLPGPVATYRFGDVAIQPTPGLVLIYPTANSEESLTLCENVARRILEKLPHTPVQGIGLNFLFRVHEPDPTLLRRFDDPEQDRFAECGYSLMALTLNRRLSYPKLAADVVVNLRATRDIATNSVNFDFNFHFDAKSSAEARARIEGRYRHAFQAAKDTLQTIFDLTEADYDDTQ